MAPKTLSIARLFEDQREDLQLELLSESLASACEITVSDINRPGMALMGFVENFLPERIQILAQTELTYLATLSPEGVREARARGRWLWPSGEGGETVIPGEWYVSAPSASPVAGAFVGQPVDSFPPLLEITPLEAGSGEGVGLNAQLGWIYVALRVLHSLIQATVNRVKLRFLVFALSSFVLMALVALAVMQLF